MIIRKATPKDLPAIRRLNKFRKILAKCSPLDHLDPNDKPGPGEKDYYEIYLYGKNKWLYVAEDEGKILGFILFKIKTRESFWKVKKVGYVDLIYIDKKARRKGISRLLMEEAHRIFKEKGMKYTTLCVQTDNKYARKVWQKHGYKEHLVDLYKKL